MTDASKYDTRICELGEGVFWHPLQKRLYWFDILSNRLLARDGDTPFEWQFKEHISAAGWLDENRLFLASETGLWQFDPAQNRKSRIVALEADMPWTRSNDGRADPMGGFWIGTMGKQAQKAAGAIYRYYKGELRQLVSGVTIPNSICFAADGRTAFYTDTAIAQIMRQPLDAEGWPDGPPIVFLDFAQAGISPDGSVMDAQGGLWNAQWGLGRVVRYLPDGEQDCIVTVGGDHASCPAFGGDDMSTLFVTTALEGINAPDDNQGCLYAAQTQFTGVAEPRVIL